ncbi:hypothetical protein Micbo1qcDRAFT_181289 [Microdochium bolleyi]|uniref:Uncharacterized protein n=1 Tax=Microdochium bolleyi TaxID=196109 RepID=A0A136IJF5_9PEZI|nr:hypothetical protein Micbo1qcDRAFT_181289 [Microdochium bolleyi]
MSGFARQLQLEIVARLERSPLADLSQAKTAVDPEQEEAEATEDSEKEPGVKDVDPEPEAETAGNHERESDARDDEQGPAKVAETPEQESDAMDVDPEPEPVIAASDSIPASPARAESSVDSATSHNSLPSQATPGNITHDEDTQSIQGTIEVAVNRTAFDPTKFFAYAKVCDPRKPGAMDTWSGTMWDNFVNSAAMHSHRATIFKMVAYMGFSEWFERQSQNYQTELAVHRRGRSGRRIASIILDLMIQPEDGSCKKRRLRLIRIKSHGNKLRSIVSRSGWWILFHKQLWEFVKSEASFLRVLAELNQLSYLEPLTVCLDIQFQKLITEGRTAFGLFLHDLTSSHQDVLLQQAEEMRTQYDMTEVNALIVNQKLDALRTRLLAMFGRDGQFSNTDRLWINQRFQIDCCDIERLRPGQWLNQWKVRHYNSIKTLECTNLSAFKECKFEEAKGSNDRGKCLFVRMQSVQG